MEPGLQGMSPRTSGPAQGWHSPGWPGLPGAQRAEEDTGRQGLGFIPGLPNEQDEENGEKSLFERRALSPVGVPRTQNQGILSELLVAPSRPHPCIIRCQFRAGTAGTQC